jgi:hypothetical protein
MSDQKCTACGKDIGDTGFYSKGYIQECLPCYIKRYRNYNNRKNKVELYTVLVLLLIWCGMLFLIAIH